MSTTLAAFSFETQLTTSPITLISTNTSQKAFIGNLTFTNTSSSDVEVIVWRLLSATTPTTGSGGNWFDRVTIQAGRSLKLTKIIGHTLNQSMVVKAQAGTANVINADASGTIET